LINETNMDPTAQTIVRQNVNNSGSNNITIVAAGNVVLGPPPSLASNVQPETVKRRAPRRWLGASAGVATFIPMAMLATWALHQQPGDPRLDGRAPVAGMRAAHRPLSPPSVWPEGKSALCNDGWYSPSHTRSGTCSAHEGVAYWRFPADDPFWRR
jgi:hypothetical protein